MTMGGNNIEQIGENAPGGSSFGASTTSKISFYGVAPAAQMSVGTLATTVPTSTNPYGFSSAQATTILNAVAAMQTLGLLG